MRRTSPRRLFADKAARWIVTAGGLAIIASILGILFFILHEVAPLAFRASVATERVHALPGGRALAVLTDEYRELVAACDADGHVRVARLATGELVADVAVVPGPVASSAVSVPPGSTAFVVATGDGRVLVQRVSFTVSFVNGRRVA
jgi:phosphate transport system permease protein